jgi:glycosyltransferase involved in cell wall biosynthesis
MTELTVLMPCLNESETVAVCVTKAFDFLERSGVEGEVLVVDNGSTDGSSELAEAAGARVIREERKGYGRALRTGIEHAAGRYVVMGDCDDSYDFSRLDGFLDQLRAGSQFVMGNRFLGGIEPNAMPRLHRYLGNPVLSFIGRLFFGTSVRDFHCGLRGFHADAMRTIGLRTDGMEFASEMVVKARLNGLRISEVPTTLSRDGREHGRPHLRTWRDGWRHLRFLLLFSPRWLFLIPGMLLMLAGVAAAAWLLGGSHRVAGFGLDVNTLVYAAAAIVGGVQLVSFYGFAYLSAVRLELRQRRRGMGWIESERLLEGGLIVALLLALVGLGLGFYSVLYWRGAGFGQLDPRQSLRIVVPAATALILALQVGSAVFFLSVLNLPHAGLRR